MPDFIYFVRPARETFPGDATEAELGVIGEHMAYLKQKLDDGQLVLVGRTQDEKPIGICIFEAENLEAANAFTYEDPAVAKGIFVPEVRPYDVFLMRGRDDTK